jgi:hypothetical protein
MLIQLQKLYVPFTSLARYTDSFLGCVLFHVRQYGSTSQKYTWAAIISPWPHTTGMYLASVFSCRRVGRLAVTICSESCTRTRACTRAARWRVLLLYSYRQTSRARRRQRYLPKPSSRASHACQFFFFWRKSHAWQCMEDQQIMHRRTACWRVNHALTLDGLMHG